MEVELKQLFYFEGRKTALFREIMPLNWFYLENEEGFICWVDFISLKRMYFQVCVDDFE